MLDHLLRSLLKYVPFRRLKSKINIWALLIYLSVLSIPCQASARWLWIKGLHEGSGCEKSKETFEKFMIDRLLELTGETLNFDGQMLSCDTDECAKARLMTIGGTVAILHTSKCIGSNLLYEVRLNTSQAKPLVYKSTIEIGLTHQTISQKGIKLAERIIKGKRPRKVSSNEAKLLSYGFTLGTSQPNISEYDVAGFLFRIDIFHRVFTSSNWQLRYGLAYISQSNDLVYRSISRGDVGFNYILNYNGLTPWFTVGLSVASVESAMIKSEKESLQEEPRVDLIIERYQDQQHSIEFTPFLESGVILTSGHLQPHLSVRVNHFGLGIDHSSELSFLFGLRWL